MQRKSRVGLIIAVSTLSILALVLQVPRLALTSRNWVSGGAISLIIVAGVITAVLLVDRRQRRVARGFIREVELQRARVGSRGLVIPVWLHDSPEQLAPYAVRLDGLPVGMVMVATERNLAFYSEDDELLATVPSAAVEGFRRDFRFASPNPISAEVIQVEVSTQDGFITLYPGKPKGERVRWLRGESLEAAIHQLNDLLGCREPE